MTKSWLAMQISSPTQSCSLHSRSLNRFLLLSLGHLPKPRVGMRTCLAFDCRPPPQATEQGVQSVQRARVQSRSHDMVLHASVSSAVLQAKPPFFGLTMSERVRERTPPSQSAVHLDQPDHSDISQSTGHFFWLHFIVRPNCGHRSPHSSGGWTTTLRLMCCQPPHVYTSVGSGTAGHVSSHSTVHF